MSENESVSLVVQELASMFPKEIERLAPSDIDYVEHVLARFRSYDTITILRSMPMTTTSRGTLKPMNTLFDAFNPIF